jgi:hypothetical protein
MYAVEVGLSFVLAGFVGGFMTMYLLGAVSIVFEHGDKKFQFLVEGVLITYGCGLCIREVSTNILWEGWWWWCELWCKSRLA